MKSVHSDRMALLGVLGPLILAIVLLLCLCIGGFHVLSAVRAFVGGESLWSKARSSAVASLHAHVIAGRPADYRRFLESLAVIVGDRTARLEMEKPQPDLQVVRDGFIAGENSPEDIAGMIQLYRYFRHAQFMEEAISAWADGDRLIEQLQELGLRIHLHVERGDGPGVMAPLLVDLDALDARLVSVEKYFSATLGRASRKTGDLLVASTLALSGLLALGGALLVRRAMLLQLKDRQLLIEANQRWELAADAAGIGLFEWHIAEDFFHLDRRASAFYRVSDGDGEREGSEQTLKRSEIRALTHPDDLAFVRHDLEEAMRSAGLFKNRYRALLPSGKVRYLEAIGRVRQGVGDAANEARMIGIVRDVGGEVTQARLTVEKEAAERIARLRIEFLSRLSHELRTPLNAVLGVAQLLSMDPSEPLSDHQQKRVKILKESGEHLLRLVEDVLDISRIDSGSIAVNNVPTDLMSAVRSSLNVVEPERASGEIRIDDRMPHLPVMVEADPQRLQQVFVNLLSNGCKFNRRGGTLSLVLREDDRHVWVLATDEGEGIAPEQLGELFQPFRRLASSPHVPGAGLGLVVTKLLIEQMHGAVSVESTPGRGSTFTVKLRRA
jgi:signal transduction histidine kinase